MRKKKYTYEEVKEIIENFGCKLLSTEYKNTITPLIIKCECGETFERTLKIINRSSICKCEKCTKKHLNDSKKIYTFDFIKEYIESFKYKLISIDCKDIKEKLKIECDKGHTFDMDFSHFYYRNQRCPCCYRNIKSTQQEVEEYFNSFNYELLSEYEGNNKPLKIKCPNGHITNTMTFGRFKQGSRCSKCCNNQILDYEEVKEYFELFGYKLLSEEYINAQTNLTIKCPKGHITNTICWNNFQQGKRCSICNESKGEKEIENILYKYNIEFIQQYKFENCKFYNCLPFDFYLSNYNVCIEYDGEQHFKIIEHFGGFDGFIDRIIRDTIKNEYCKKNNIKLIRIPYWDFDRIEEILIKELELK